MSKFEDTPMLDSFEPDGYDEEEVTSLDSRPGSLRSRTWWPCVKSPDVVIILVASTGFSVIAMASMLAIPVMRLIEDSFCHAFYDDGSLRGIEEIRCKNADIQSRLAFFAGWSRLFHSILSLIVVSPFGIMADKIGRKPTLIFSYAGLVLSFAFQPLLLHSLPRQVSNHPYIMLCGSTLLLLGGGLPALLACLYSIASDVSPDDKKAAAIIRISFGINAGGIFGPIVTSLLMQAFGLWVPIYVVFILTPFVFVLLMACPETLRRLPKHEDHLRVGPTSLQTRIHDLLEEMKVTVGLLKNRNLRLLLCVFFVQNARLMTMTSLINQHLSSYFQWTLAQASLLTSPFGVLNLIILGILPAGSRALTSPKFGYTEFGKDLFLTQTSIFLFVCGSAVQGLSHSTSFFLIGTLISAAGAADSPLARATSSHYVSNENTSRLHSLIGITEILGSFIGGPVVAWLFDRGLKMEGFWIGLPWFYISFLGIFVRIALCFVRAPKISL